MSLPNYREFIVPLLKVLAAHPHGMTSRDAVEGTATATGLTDDQRKELLPSGTELTYQNRITWAHDRLKRFGLSSAPKRGFYVVTQKGLDFLAAHPNGVEVSKIREMERGVLRKSLAEIEGRPERRTSQEAETESVVAASTETELGAEERIEQAMLEWHKSVAADLLDLIASAAPVFFEHLVLDVLHAMGYGVSRKEVMHMGKSGDEGIDGVISMDRLGLQKVYVQAKRWENRVGRPEIQAFYGSLAGHRATYGVFITTSDFSREALEYAKAVSDSLVLVDGDTLAGLMIEHEVGVTHKALKLAKVDHDYFEVG